MPSPRFLTPVDVAEILNTSLAQVMALIKDGDLVSIQIGGRRQHRIEVSELEAYIQREYDNSRARRPRSAQPAEHDQVGERDGVDRP